MWGCKEVWEEMWRVLRSVLGVGEGEERCGERHGKWGER